MRNRLFLSLIAAAGLLAASAAQAGTLTAATWTQNLQNIALTATNMGATCIDTVTTHVPGDSVVICPTAGIGATGSRNDTTGAYSVSLTMPLFSVNLFTTGGTININTMGTLQGAQMINGNNVGATVDMGIPGGVTVKNAVHTMGSMFVAGMTTLVKLPLSAGVADTFTGSFTVLGSFHYITVDFFAWTPMAVSFMGLTTMGMTNLPDAMGTGGVVVTGMGATVVTLVAPSKISIDGPAAQRRTAGFTTLKLTFAPSVPEPSTLLLLGAGVAGLALIGSRKTN